MAVNRSMSHSARISPHAFATLTCVALLVVTPGRACAQLSAQGNVGDLVRAAAIDSSSLKKVVASLAGRSGKLLARFVLPPRPAVPSLTPNLPYTSRSVPVVKEIAGASRVGRFSLITMRSFSDKVAGYVGPYRIGYWPDERGRARSQAYEHPPGFIEVTRENQHTPISEHFRLRDFLTHDQQNVWPKYLVLQEPLIDKLELVIQELERRGIRASGMKVLSGFRTPQYNRALGDGSGRARDSRHQYGDAADVYIDNDGNGRMDDLNGDGRVNSRDTRVILTAVDRIEQMYPDLVGGTGLYHATGSHGPFAHIDVRGDRARWGTGVRVARSSKSRRGRSTAAKTATRKKARSASRAG